MKFGVVVFPGSNCDLDVYDVIKKLLDKPVEYLWHQDPALKNCDVVVLPGGFSYGDYLRPGAIARFSPIMNSVQEFAANGGLVLGICNGFQVLTEAGMLPGALYRNTHLQFRCKYTNLRVENDKLPFTSDMYAGEALKMPVANGDGNYYIKDAELKDLETNAQIVFRYVDAGGEIEQSANPSGSVQNIAGVCNSKGNVLGMMPHPERAAEKLLGSEDGLKLFNSIVAYLSQRKG